MAHTKNDFTESDLETLAKLGITTDRTERLRIGHDMAKQMGLGGGRWLRKEEDSGVKDAIVGYWNLPESMRTQGIYSPLEYLQIAAAAGQLTVPDLSQDYEAKQRGLVERLEAVNFRASGDGRPPQRVRDMYWDFNEGQKTAGNAPVYPDQFAGMLIDSVERDVMRFETAAQELIGGVKKYLKISPQNAMLNAVEASYMLSVVNAVKPQLNIVRDKYEQRQAGTQENDLQPVSVTA